MSDETTAEQPATAPPPDRGLILVLNRDLFFGLRIVETLRAAGYAVTLAPTAAALLARLAESAASPALVIVDLGAGPDWAALRGWIADPARVTPLLAFGPHRDVAAMRAAKAAGVDRLVSNGEFHRDLRGLVERYARR